LKNPNFVDELKTKKAKNFYEHKVREKIGNTDIQANNRFDTARNFS